MKKFLLASLFAAFAFGVPAECEAKDISKDPYRGYDETVYMDMELEDNLKAPTVSKNEHNAVKSYMTRLGKDLAKKNYIVDLMRDDEVVLVTIPSDDIFLPNDTLLSPAAPAKLAPIISLLSDPYMSKWSMQSIQTIQALRHIICVFHTNATTPSTIGCSKKSAKTRLSFLTNMAIQILSDQTTLAKAEKRTGESKYS